VIFYTVGSAHHNSQTCCVKHKDKCTISNSWVVKKNHFKLVGIAWPNYKLSHT